MEPTPAVNDSNPKKVRHRKKLLYANIRELMHFYFSDSNLSKDRFLMKLIEENEYVDLSVFLTFNKIRKLNVTIDHLRKAISKSDVLILSEDRNSVKRKVPPKVKENTDACTIYVENLKADITHEWLSSFFSEFGNVVYVSIPKYKGTGLIKGFAFVEFEDDDGVKEALNYFESIDCKIPSDREPSKLASIVTFENSEKFGKANNVAEDNKPPEETTGEESATETSTNQSRKRKLDDDSDDTESKKLKIDEKPSAKLRKAQKKANKRKSQIKELGLRILTKKEWKQMRNRYLDMQRKNMKKLKQHLFRQRFSAPNYETKPTKPSAESLIQTEELDFIPGTIVKLTLLESCLDGKKLKKEIKEQSPDIKYVDIPPFGDEIYIRFSKADSAQLFCKTDCKGMAVVLEGEEEQQYWDKIRESKSLKEQKLKQRGRDKLLKKAEKFLNNTHIKFEDDDE